MYVGLTGKEGTISCGCVSISEGQEANSVSKPTRLQFTFPHFPDEKTVNELLTKTLGCERAAAPTCIFRNIFATMCYCGGINSLESRTLWFLYEKYSRCKVHSSNMLQHLQQVGRSVAWKCSKSTCLEGSPGKETECKPARPRFNTAITLQVLGFVLYPVGSLLDFRSYINNTNFFTHNFKDTTTQLICPSN